MLVDVYRSAQFMRPRGLGETAAAAPPGFVEGVTAWQSPGTAFTSLTSPAGKSAAYLAGLALPVLGALFMAKSLMGGRRR